VIIYALMMCSTVLHPSSDCRPSVTFESLVECRQFLESTQRRSVGADGRLVVASLKDGREVWWQCASRHVEQWEAQ
jgi:hypothetical protein